MPKGPQGQRRPADSLACAIMVDQLATGEITEILTKPSGEIRLGIAGDKARAKNLSQKERAAIVKKAAAQHWR